MSVEMNIPDGWEEKSFSDLAKINMGQSPESEFVNENKEGMAFLQGNADFGEINPEESYWVTQPKKVAEKGDILISVRAPVGDMNIADKKYCIGRGLAALDINKIDAFYGFYALFQERKQLDRLSQGSTFLAISKDDFDVLKIKYPIDIKEQQRIAKILSTLDQAIESSKKIIAKEKNIKKGLMQDLFTNGIDENGKIRTLQTHNYKESELGMIPEKWEVEKIAKLVEDKVLDKVQDGNHGELHPKSEDFVDTGIPFIMASDIQSGHIDLEKCKRISTKTYHSLRIGFSHSGDVLLSHKASIGFTAIVPQDLKIMLTPQVTYYRILNEKSMLNTFLMYYFQSNGFQKILDNLAKQSTRDYIGISMQKELPIYYPIDIKEQQQIASILTIQDKKVETEEKNLAKLKSLKKGLMSDLLSGKVRVKI